MSKRKLTLTEDHLKLIPFILIKDEKDECLEIDRERMLILQTSLLEDVSLILGLRYKAIPNTEYAAEGRAFPEDVEQYMFDVYNYVRDNLYNIETLIHQFVCHGGITVGNYVYDEAASMWIKN